MFSDSQWNGVLGITEVHSQRPCREELHVSYYNFDTMFMALRHMTYTRIDSHFLIKITDFGLSEDVFLQNYFRQGAGGEVVKLPVKWMAPESLSDGHFSEKSDVVSV